MLLNYELYTLNDVLVISSVFFQRRLINQINQYVMNSHGLCRVASVQGQNICSWSLKSSGILHKKSGNSVIIRKVLEKSGNLKSCSCSWYLSICDFQTRNASMCSTTQSQQSQHFHIISIFYYVVFSSTPLCRTSEDGVIQGRFYMFKY